MGLIVLDTNIVQPVAVERSGSFAMTLHGQSQMSPIVPQKNLKLPLNSKPPNKLGPLLDDLFD